MFQNLEILENAMLAQEVSIPVYFARDSPSIDTILSELSTNIVTDDKSKSAMEAMIGSVAANGYQISYTPKTPAVQQNIKIANIYGHLLGRNLEGKAQTITIVTHYDAFGVAPVIKIF